MAGRDYLERGLGRMTDATLLKAKQKFIAVQSDFALRGQSNNGRKYVCYEDVICKVLREDMPQWTRFTFNASGGTDEPYALVLEGAGIKLVDEIVDWLTEKYKNAEPFGDRLPPLAVLKTKLHAMVSSAVDDFRNGMIGVEGLKQDKSNRGGGININDSTVTGVTVQYASGENIRQSVQHAEKLTVALDGLLSSNEIRSLSADDRAKVEGVALELRREVEKQDADQSLVTKLGRGLLSALKDVGLAVAGAAIAKTLGY